MSGISGAETKLSNYKTGKYNSKLGTANKVSFNFVLNGIDVKQTTHIFYADNYLFQITVTDLGDNNTTLDLNTLSEYIIDSVKISEE